MRNINGVILKVTRPFRIDDLNKTLKWNACVLFPIAILHSQFSFWRQWQIQLCARRTCASAKKMQFERRFKNQILRGLKSSSYDRDVKVYSDSGRRSGVRGEPGIKDCEFLKLVGNRSRNVGKRFAKHSWRRKGEVNSVEALTMILSVPDRIVARIP